MEKFGSKNAILAVGTYIQATIVNKKEKMTSLHEVYWQNLFANKSKQCNQKGSRGFQAF